MPPCRRRAMRTARGRRRCDVPLGAGPRRRPAAVMRALATRGSGTLVDDVDAVAAGRGSSPSAWRGSASILVRLVLRGPFDSMRNMGLSGLSGGAEPTGSRRRIQAGAVRRVRRCTPPGPASRWGRPHDGPAGSARLAPAPDDRPALRPQARAVGARRGASPPRAWSPAGPASGPCTRSDVRFEHCMALDARSDVKPTLRRAVLGGVDRASTPSARRGIASTTRTCARSSSARRATSTRRSVARAPPPRPTRPAPSRRRR